MNKHKQTDLTNTEYNSKHITCLPISGIFIVFSSLSGQFFLGEDFPHHQGTGSSSSEGFSTLGRASTKTANVNVDGPLLLSYEWRDTGSFLMALQMGISGVIPNP